MTLEIRLLGDFALRQDGRLVAGQARTNLRNLLHRLRQAWPEANSWIAFETKSLAWRPGAALWPDVAQFEDHLQQAQAATDPAAVQAHLRQAIELYRNDLLLSCHDDWIEPLRARLRHAFLHALEQLAGLLQAAGDYSGAIRLFDQLTEAEPLEESYYRRLIGLHGLAGDRAAGGDSRGPRAACGAAGLVRTRPPAGDRAGPPDDRRDGRAGRHTGRPAASP